VPLPRSLVVTLAAVLVGAAVGAVAYLGRGPRKVEHAESGPPRLRFAQERVSFGTRFDDEAPNVTVTLLNVGGETLHVHKIEPSCGCILVGHAPTELAPGGRVDVRMEVRLAGFDGPFERVVAFHTDDLHAQPGRVSLIGEVKPKIAVAPPAVVAAPATLEATTTVDLDVTSTVGEPIATLTVNSTAPWTTVTTALERDKARLRVVVQPFADDFTGSLVLRLGKSERVVPVFGRAARDVRVAPDKLWIGSEEMNRTVRAELVARDGAPPWRVLSVESSRKDLEAKLEGGRVLVARIADDAPKGRFEGLVTLTFEGAKPDKVRVPVLGWVSD
jgi:hypothetical protein